MRQHGAASPWVARACCTLLLAVILAYAMLLPRARWQGDEYFILGQMRDGGWPYIRSWYLGWSPRLVSDILYVGYGAAVQAMHRPLAASCMALLWAMLGCACVLPARATPHRQMRVPAGLALFALFLAGHAVTETFYWPAGGLSYLPTLAGTVWLFWLCADGLQARQASAAAALFITAGSSEVGVFIALAACACIGAAQIGRPWQRWAWMLPGLALALLDLALVLHGRVGTPEGRGADPALLHHAGASLAAAVPRLLHTLAMPDTGAALLPSLVARILIFAAARGSLGTLRGPALPAFGAGLLLAAYLSIASANYQFGRPCCQRHDTMRACLVVLAIAAFGASSVRLWPVARTAFAAPAWAAATLILFLPATPALWADLRQTGQATADRTQTWQSGKAAGPDMVFIRDPEGQVINATRFATGNFEAGHGLAWYQDGILGYFHKQRMIVTDAK